MSQMEAQFLKDWIERNADFVGMYPFDRIYRQLIEVLKDGFVDSDESADLHDTLARFVGGEAYSAEGQTASRSTSLPLDNPCPIIHYTGTMFVVTGTFSFGARSAVHAAIEGRGSEVSSSPTRKTNYLVIGDLGSRDWINSNAGRKIEKAVQLREDGYPLAIISEAAWLASLSP
ncbi:MAG TPA: hypothetical protein VM619_10770 [Luteimonas sp.]|nr:hypothetical protein [Luteimonas sp.]